MTIFPNPELRPVLLWLTAGLVVYALLTLLGPVLTPFLGAAVIGYVLNPGVDWLTARGLPRMLSVLLVMLGLILTIAAVALIVLPTLASELPALEQRLPLLLDGFDRAIRPLLVQAGLNLPLDSAGLKSLLAQQLSNMDSAGISWLDWLKKGSSAVIGWVATLLLVPIVLFYLLLDWHHVIARFATMIPRRWISLVTDMSRETDHLLAQYLRGQLLVMLLLATYYSVALTIAGFEVAAPVGIITGLLVFIPYVGYGIGLTLAILSAILFFDGWHGLIAVGVVYGIGQMLESFYLTPRLVGERIGLHPLTVIFALLAFAQLFGFTGILVALPASAILSVVYRRVRQHYLNSSFYNQS
jgi:predicted PurR-regulated permease PerM